MFNVLFTLFDIEKLSAAPPFPAISNFLPPLKIRKTAGIFFFAQTSREFSITELKPASVPVVNLQRTKPLLIVVKRVAVVNVAVVIVFFS